MEQEIINQRVRVLYEDLGNSCSKIGKLILRDNDFIWIEMEGNRVNGIPISKILRMELL